MAEAAAADPSEPGRTDTARDEARKRGAPAEVRTGPANQAGPVLNDGKGGFFHDFHRDPDQK